MAHLSLINQEGIKHKKYCINFQEMLVLKQNPIQTETNLKIKTKNTRLHGTHCARLNRRTLGKRPFSAFMESEIRNAEIKY